MHKIPLCDGRIMSHCLSLISGVFLIQIVSANDNYCIDVALSTSFFNDIIHSQRGRWGEAIIIKLHTQCCYFLLCPDGSWYTTGCLEHVKRKAIQTSRSERDNATILKHNT